MGGRQWGVGKGAVGVGEGGQHLGTNYNARQVGGREGVGGRWAVGGGEGGHHLGTNYNAIQVGARKVGSGWEVGGGGGEGEQRPRTNYNAIKVGGREEGQWAGGVRKGVGEGGAWLRERGRGLGKRVRGMERREAAREDGVECSTYSEGRRLDSHTVVVLLSLHVVCRFLSCIYRVLCHIDHVLYVVRCTPTPKLRTHPPALVWCAA